jgi:hypothetical protein
MAAARRRKGRPRPAPLALRIAAGVALALVAALVANGLYQVIRKPSELLFPVSDALYKTPEQTWHTYAALFQRYATAAIPASLLAALAQQEASGNPLARTYWRWSWVARPFEIYRPASSAVGLYQITDTTFAQARHYCVHDHAVVSEGRWDDWHACWFNSLYTRVVPGDAIELTAAYLDITVRTLLERHGLAAEATRVRHVAATVHLCGAGAADAYLRRGARFAAGERCGDHDPRAYLKRVDELDAQFRRLASAAQ